MQWLLMHAILIINILISGFLIAHHFKIKKRKRLIRKAIFSREKYSIAQELHAKANPYF